MITEELKLRFEKIIELNDIDWSMIDNIVQKDANILRPIKGIAFEEYFKKILRKNINNINIQDGEGDSDVDVYVNNLKLQLKTPVKNSTTKDKFVGVALHKTHGLEKRPHNLYNSSEKTFDFLVLQHPESGIFIIPHNEIPKHNSWDGYLADPAKIEWENKRLNNWGVIGLDSIDGKIIDDRIAPKNSLLPFLSKETYLEDYEIIEMLCKPEYFRAAVMGLKGNLKEFWFEEYLRKQDLKVIQPEGPYPKYDVAIENKNGYKIKIQTKGTSKNMCDIDNNKIGVEIMGTHGRFPNRGYKRNELDYVSVIISNHQLPRVILDNKLHFILLPVKDLPMHYKINKGDFFKELDWNKKEYSDVLYPNIKLKLNLNNKKEIEFIPDIDSYGKSNGFNIIAEDSVFREAGPYKLDFIPDEFYN